MSTREARGTLNNAVAAQIRAERARLHVSQAEVAKRAHMSRGVYIRLENAERDIKVDQLAQIAAVFGITVAELFRRAEEHRPGTWEQIEAAARAADPLFKSPSTPRTPRAGEVANGSGLDGAGHGGDARQSG